MSSMSSTATVSNSVSNRLPITEAACKSVRSFGARRSTRAVNKLCTLAGIAAATAFVSNSTLPAVRTQHATLGEEAHDLFGEQRIALGFLRHLPRQRLGQSVNAEPCLNQVADVACGERLQR